VITTGNYLARAGDVHGCVLDSGITIYGYGHRNVLDLIAIGDDLSARDSDRTDCELLLLRGRGWGNCGKEGNGAKGQKGCENTVSAHGASRDESASGWRGRRLRGCEDRYAKGTIK